MKKIALFGGAFDPPHFGHLTVATTLIDKKLVDEVWFVPAGDHPFAKRMRPAVDRIALLKLAVKSLAKHYHATIKVEEWEYQQSQQGKGPSYSLHTLDHFSATYPDCTFVWVIGSDNIGSLHKWWHIEDMRSRYQIWVYPRAGWDMAECPADLKKLYEVPEIALSSTEVREKFATHIQTSAQNPSIDDLSQLVPKDVAEYSIQHHLYDSATTSH